MTMTYRTQSVFRHVLSLLTLTVIIAAGTSVYAGSTKSRQKSFTSPEAAVAALVAAVKGNDTKSLKAILGPGSGSLISSGDSVADATDRETFGRLFVEMNRIDQSNPARATLIIGAKEYPFPIPLVKRGKVWLFDTKAGREEILNRRIGKNELRAIEVVHAYVDAQREYATTDRNSDNVLEFAQKLTSHPGKKDGLYWETKEGEKESPFGPLAARAAHEGYKGAEGPPEPFHGYYFRILKGQGEHAEGGAYDYVVNDKMVLGFALVAYPARYGASGIMTFIVNQSGVVYQKNLGKDTARIVSGMKQYDPDTTWKKVE